MNRILGSPLVLFVVVMILGGRKTSGLKMVSEPCCNTWLIKFKRRDSIIIFTSVRKYFIKTCIKLEEQIKHRKASWLIGVPDYILSKEFYERDAETLIEFRKTYTDRKENLFHLTSWLKRKDRFPSQHRTTLERIREWKAFLINEYQSIEVCYI